jgi:predicted neuraminidase
MPALTRRQFLASATLLTSQTHDYQAELIFPLEHWHNHASSLVELPQGGLLACWFHGSGERTADDVRILASLWSARTARWSTPFQLADTPGFPDINPVLFVDSKKRLWLFWAAILANEWETALMKYRRAENPSAEAPPHWTSCDNILLIPRNLQARIQETLKADLRPTPFGRYAGRLAALAADKLSARLGWFTRTRPLELPSGRLLLPLYSDGFSMSLMAISDDGGATWFASEPIVGYGNIQPTLFPKRDGSLVAYMRDNGPPPKRIQRSISKDEGLTWSPAEDTEFPNPGSSVAGLALKSGRWILAYNDLERGRHSLAISMSEDEGASWPWKRHLERDAEGQFHYPFLIQANDGSIHVTYSYFIPGPDGKAQKSIKHARFSETWLEKPA